MHLLDGRLVLQQFVQGVPGTGKQCCFGGGIDVDGDRFFPMAQSLGLQIEMEISAGIILHQLLQLFDGLLIGSVAQIRYSIGALAISVGLAVISSMSVAALVGSLVPMAFARIHIDPAVATGPFVTTAIDIISVTFYFMIATALLGL